MHYKSRPQNTCHCSSFAVINVSFFTLSTRQINSSHPSNTSFVGSEHFPKAVSDPITLSLDLKKNFHHDVLLVSKIWPVVSQPPMAWTKSIIDWLQLHNATSWASSFYDWCGTSQFFNRWNCQNHDICVCALDCMYIISCLMYPGSIKNKKSVCFFLTTIQIYNIFCGLIW